MTDAASVGNDNVEFICQKCHKHEKIPREIVIMLDGSDLAYSPDQLPQFVCEDCGGAMSPVYYRNELGYEFRLEDK
ncbi:hypothetical protein [Enterococcus lactis]|uniref:hypothetical protein n=1 Tax=Enterococcus lactis TaxID=357441 RepID=UPI00192C066A|nr:hypothetical protein [Enterococcus lactis]